MGLVEPDGEGNVEESGQILPILQADGAQLNIQLYCVILRFICFKLSFDGGGEGVILLTFFKNHFHNQN